jgi:hypothetical protein
MVFSVDAFGAGALYALLGNPAGTSSAAATDAVAAINMRFVVIILSSQGYQPTRSTLRKV